MTTKPQSTTTKLEASEPTLEPCGVCKFHWNMIVMPGEKHHRYCPHYDDDGKGCACHGCAQRYRVDIQIPDDLWERIKPEGRESGAGLLCGSCISSRIEALGEFDAYTLTRVSANRVPTVDQAAIKCNDSNMEAWRKIFDRVTSTVPYSDEQPLRGVVKDANTVIKLLYKEVLSLRAAASPVAPQQSEPQYLTINGQRRMVIPCPDGKPDCEVLHTAPAPSAAIQDEVLEDEREFSRLRKEFTQHALGDRPHAMSAAKLRRLIQLERLDATIRATDPVLTSEEADLVIGTMPLQSLPGPARSESSYSEGVDDAARVDRVLNKVAVSNLSSLARKAATEIAPALATSECPWCRVHPHREPCCFQCASARDDKRLRAERVDQITAIIERCLSEGES